MSEMERIVPLIDQYAKDLEKTPLQEEMTKINALKISQAEKEKKLKAFGAVATMKSFRYMFDLSLRFIADTTDDNEGIRTQIGDNFSLATETAAKIQAELTIQVIKLSQEMSQIKETYAPVEFTN